MVFHVVRLFAQLRSGPTSKQLNCRNDLPDSHRVSLTLAEKDSEEVHSALLQGGCYDSSCYRALGSPDGAIGSPYIPSVPLSGPL